MTQFQSMQLPPRLPLVVQTGNRNGSVTKDARLVNCYVETDTAQQLWVIKRPGMAVAKTTVAAQGLGCYNWKGDVYAVFGGTLFKNGVSVAGATALNTTGGKYYFSQILGATPKLLLKNNEKAYAYDPTNGFSSDLHTLDTDFPAATVAGIEYLNGATYVMQAGGQIWGSKVNSVTDPADWNALDFIAAQIEPDDGVCLAKQLVYLIAFGQWSTEVFFDAGNPQGSPLGNVQGSKISYGCAVADSVQQIDDQLLWISSTRSGATQVSLLRELQHQVISTKAIDRLLQADDLGVVYSWQIKCSGHSFYVLTLKNSNVTLAYDLVENEWHQWTDSNGNYIPVVASTFDSQKRHILQHETNGSTYYCGPDYTNDAGNKIFVDIYTPIFDANSARRKVLTRMEFVGDQQRGSTLFARCSDDDYQSWTNFRSVRLDQKKPALVNCGTFVKRAYHFRHWADTPFRIQAVDVQYDMGTL